MNGYISGLVSGEGNFTIAVSKTASCRLGLHARAIFQMEMSIVDEDLLLRVQRFWGYGYMNYPKPRTRVVKESPTCKLIVTDLAGHLRLIDFFEKNPLLGAKQKSFEVWKKCVRIIEAGRHRSDDGMREILRLREGMNQFRRPATFVQAATHEVDMEQVQGRSLRPWTDEELAIASSYLAGAMSRTELTRRLGRTSASVAAQLTRMRAAVR